MNPNRNFFDSISKDGSHQGLPITKPLIQSALPYPFSAPDEHSLDGLGRIPEQSQIADKVFEYMYKFFRTFKVMDCIPPSVLVQTADITITIREALTLITTQELSQILLIDPDDYSLAGLLTYTDLINVLLKANGLKVTKTDFFNCSVREWREKVMSGDECIPNEESRREIPENSIIKDEKDLDEEDFDSDELGSSSGEEEKEEKEKEEEEEENKMKELNNNNFDWMSRKFVLPNVTLRDVIAIRPSGTLWEAIILMMNYSIHKLPVVDSEGHTIYVLTHDIILSCLVLRCDFSNPIFRVRLGDVNIGQFHGVHTCHYNTNMLEVLTTFVLEGKKKMKMKNNNRISLGGGVTFIPIVDENDSVVDVFTKGDLLNLVQMILKTTNPLLFTNDDGDDNNNSKNKQDLILLEEICVKDVCEQRKRRNNHHHHQQQQQISHPPHNPFHQQQQSNQNDEILRTDVIRFTTKKSESFGRMLRHLTGTKTKHLVCISEDQRRSMEGIISCQDVFNFLISHHKDD